jgi:hypothetical protein
MSDVIGRWIIGVQDAMPAEMRNSARWKDLLPRAAGTGKMHEKERLEIILDWMWATVLPTLQPMADGGGFGTEWLRMIAEKNLAAAMAAADAAWAAVDAAADAADAAREAARVAARAADAAERAAADAADAARAAARVAARAADAAERAAADAADAAWDRFDPCRLLQKLVEVSE